MRGSPAAIGFAGLFTVIVLMCLSAPLYSKHVAHTGPLDTHEQHHRPAVGAIELERCDTTA